MARMIMSYFVLVLSALLALLFVAQVQAVPVVSYMSLALVVRHELTSLFGTELVAFNESTCTLVLALKYIIHIWIGDHCGIERGA